jgi:hypothetical protein
VVEAANAQFGGNVQGIAEPDVRPLRLRLRARQLALLITAAVGAMILAHRQRVTPKVDQREQAEERMATTPTKGEHPGPLPNSGVYATTNSIATPRRCCPTARSRRSRSARRCCMRGAVDRSPIPLAKVTGQTFAAIEAVEGRGGRVMNPENYLILAALLFSIGVDRRPGTPQRAGRVHVRRADAERLQPGAGRRARRSPADSTARWRPSS